MAQILEGIVPGLLRKKEEEEKRLRVAQRMQRQMDNIMLDENGGFGRSAPVLTPVLNHNISISSAWPSFQVECIALHSILML